MDIILKYFTEFTNEQLDQFRQLEPLYKEWNEKINVISRKDIDGLYEKHVLHSLSIAAVYDFTDGLSVLDLGTGGGFPGIPLAIFFPEVQFHLVDSIAKKLKVVDAVAAALKLQNVTTQHIRAEEINNRKPARPGGGFDVVVSRAVAPLKDLWKWSKPLIRYREQGTRVRQQGTAREEKEEVNYPSGLICLKGGDLAAEIQESGARPYMQEIAGLFSEDFFKEKYIVNITAKKYH